MYVEKNQTKLMESEVWIEDYATGGVAASLFSTKRYPL